MAADDEAAPHETRKTLRGAAVIGGGALLAWLLWRWHRGGGGFGGGGGGGGGSVGDRGTAGDTSDENPPARSRLVARLEEGDQISVDGVPLTLAALLARGRAAGGVELHVTGAARWGFWDDVRTALAQSGIDTVVREPPAYDLHPLSLSATCARIAALR